MPSPVTIPGISQTWTPYNVPIDAYAELGSASQAPGFGSAKILANYSAMRLPTVAAIRSILVPLGPTMIIADSFAVLGDGGGGVFAYVAGSSATDDGGIVLQPTVGSGRWIRQYAGVVLPEWFGAKGDDSTNDTTAINNAINAITSVGGTILFGPKTYRHIGIALKDGVSLIGCGAKATVLKNTSNTNSITINTGSDVRNVRVQYLRITSTGSALIGIAASQWGNRDGANFVMVDNHVTGGVSLTSCYTLVIENSTITLNTGYGILLNGTCHNSVYRHNIITLNGGDGIQVKSSFNVVISENDFEGNLGHQINLAVGSLRAISIRDNYFEGLATIAAGFYGINVAASVADTVTIDGNWFDFSNANAGASQIGFLHVATGNSRVRVTNLGFGGSALVAQYAKFVIFDNGCAFCRAQVALTDNPVTNNSSSSRIYYDDESEIGVIAGYSGSQALTSGAWNPIAADTVAADPKSEWNIGSSTFTPKDWGEYEITYSISVGMTAGDNYAVRLFDTTGSYEYARILSQGVPTGTSSLTGTFREKLGPVNTIQLQANPSAARVTFAGGVQYNWIRIKRIG